MIESRITIHHSRLLLCVAGLLAPAPATAQQYPTKPIRFIIAQAPGGQNDVQARIIGAKLSEALGQPIVYDNRPGAGGQIAFELFAQAPADGYTLGSGSIYESNSWQGIVTRAGTQGQIIARLHSETVKVLRLPEVRNPIASQGNDIAASSPEEFTAYIRSEMEKWGKVIKAAGVQGE